VAALVQQLARRIDRELQKVVLDPRLQRQRGRRIDRRAQGLDDGALDPLRGGTGMIDL